MGPDWLKLTVFPALAMVIGLGGAWEPMRSLETSVPPPDPMRWGEDVRAALRQSFCYQDREGMKLLVAVLRPRIQPT